MLGHDEKWKISHTDACDCRERHTMYHLNTCGDAPNCTLTDLAIPPLAGVNCAKLGGVYFTVAIKDLTKKNFVINSMNELRNCLPTRMSPNIQTSKSTRTGAPLKHGVHLSRPAEGEFKHSDRIR